jgi:ornithine cyclodeaminase
MWLPDRAGALGLMPAALGDRGIMGVKAVSVFPRNASTGFETHQGAVMLFETRNGRLLAMVDAGEITAIRTAAVSAVATSLLARESARKLAILGAGTQAGTHLEAMLLVRPVESVSVWSLPLEQARAFAQRASERYGVSIEPAGTAEEAVRGADLICTVTAASSPVLQGEFVEDGAHINAVGACTPAARELDTAAVVRSRLFVDRRESTLSEAGDFLIPRSEGAVRDDFIVAEIGELLVGAARGRTSEREVTLFKSVGIAVEDVAAAEYVYRRAVESGSGIRIALGGSRLS